MIKSTKICIYKKYVRLKIIVNDIKVENLYKKNTSLIIPTIII